MTFTFPFEKLLEVKEREVVEHRNSYEDAARHFEAAGYELYQWLKARENLDEKHKHACIQGTTVALIQTKQLARENIENRIKHSQKKANTARNVMAARKKEWQSAEIEIKKIERMKERKWEEYIQDMNKQEQTLMDELASRQVLLRK
ncbi:flagellar FliJ protein [Geomicrobium halophilum]|uniref:Flagellar FliJ protein n=1 Tax=Geomicrobium halophilum TaxID=549000 RepID=A0A841PKA0_9BACL|nr:flagellar export protein FliJ [Geomicrobium halophilum]MBB6449297.1 flagellar FliJ protein [Geomicrobium halophilum]